MKEKKRLSAVKLILYSRGKKNKLHHNNSELFFYLLMNLAIFRIYIYKNGLDQTTDNTALKYTGKNLIELQGETTWSSQQMQKKYLQNPSSTPNNTSL